MGSQAAGVARMEASQGQISSLILDVNGRSIRVNLLSSPKFSKGDFTSNLGKNPRMSKGDIIDVEFVEKDKK
jgi:hypothetical protein